MRQAGILAACGLISLTKLVDRLADDHARARALATELGSLPGISCDPDANPTNLVMLKTEKPAAEWAAALHEKGVWAMPAASHRLRLVTHADFTDEHLQFALGVFRSVVV
jgi:threonine aldolase